MILKEINQSIVFTVIFVLMVSVLFIDTTYSVFTINESSEEKTISFGDIDMTVTSGDTTGDYSNTIGTTVINDVTSYTPQYPVVNPLTSNYGSTSWVTTNNSGASITLRPYKFTLRNTGDTDMSVTIYLSPDTLANQLSASETLSLDGNNFTFNQTTNGPVTSTQYKYFDYTIVEDQAGSPTIQNLGTAFAGSSETVNNTTVYPIATGITLASGATKTFTVYMWLSEDELKYYSCYDQQIVCSEVRTSSGTLVETICNTKDVAKATCQDSENNINSVMGKYLVTNVTVKGVAIAKN